MYQAACMNEFFKSEKSYEIMCGYGSQDKGRDNKRGVKSLAQCACECSAIDCVKFQYSGSTCVMKTLPWLDSNRHAARNTALDPPIVRTLTLKCSLPHEI